MKVITGFEEGFATTGSPPNSSIKDYDQIPKALQHDLNVSENAFARGAKKELKQVLIERLKGDFSIKQSSECLNLFPFWVQEGSVTLKADEPSLGSTISYLVQNLADSIVNQVRGSPLVLVDPLQTHISQIGAGVYRFRLKQKWIMGNALPEGRP